MFENPHGLIEGICISRHEERASTNRCLCAQVYGIKNRRHLNLYSFKRRLFYYFIHFQWIVPHNSYFLFLQFAFSSVYLNDFLGTTSYLQTVFFIPKLYPILLYFSIATGFSILFFGVCQGCFLPKFKFLLDYTFLS